VFHPAVGYTAGDIYAESLRDIIGWNGFLAAHGEQFRRIERVADFKQAKALGKIGILIGEQNSAHFRTVEDVDRFYNLGQRVSQLTYSGNRIGAGSSDPRDSGLSQYGVSDRGAHERSWDGRRRFALRRPDYHGCDRRIPKAGPDYALQLSRSGSGHGPMQNG